MNKTTIDFKQIKHDLMCLEFLVGDLYDCKEALEENKHRNERQEGMLQMVNHLLRHVERSAE